jgi:hypothetical protein
LWRNTGAVLKRRPPARHDAYQVAEEICVAVIGSGGIIVRRPDGDGKMVARS